MPIRLIDPIFSHSPHLMAKPKRKGKNESLLWKIDAPGKGTSSYLLGTMHTRDARVHALLPGLEPYLASCAVLATEFSFEESAADPGTAWQPVDDWWEELSRKQRRQTESLMARLGLGDPAAYRTLPPLILVQLITGELLGKEAAEPLDMVLAEKARSMGLRLSGVETLEEQIGLLRNVPLSLQRKQLVHLVADFSKFRKQLDKQVSWYLEQDIRKLYKDARKQLKGLRKLMLFGRNRVMADRMASMFEESPHFFAVGAAHLGGGKGVLRLLKQKGFRVTAIPLGHDQ